MEQQQEQGSVVDPRLADMAMPEYALRAGSSSSNINQAGDCCKPPKSPMLIFINTRSGGQLGAALLQTFYQLLPSHQVYDLSKDSPEEVLSTVLRSLETLRGLGNETAEHIRRSLRLVVAGGDGTAGWLLGVVGDMKLENPPPIATIPLGTGNNLPFSFGWGKKNPGTDADSVVRFLKDVVSAHPIRVDSWHVFMKMEGRRRIQVEAPHSLHVFKKTDERNNENQQVYRGGFWNYFSIGMDAQVSYEFHKERQEHPEKFTNQLKNQCNYARIGCTQGWFCASCRHPSSWNINEIAKVYTADCHGEYEELAIPSSIRSLVLLNLPSFSGGLDPWGTPNDRKSVERGLTNPSVNDGLLEVVGFRDGWHGLFLLFPNGHGTRLAQAHRIKLEFKRGAAKSYTYMRMDGEPWKQPLPEDEETCVIEICRHGEAVMLAKAGCIAESKEAYQHMLSFSAKDGIRHGLHPKTRPPNNSNNANNSTTNHHGECSGDEDAVSDDAQRKYGAASTFRA